MALYIESAARFGAAIKHLRKQRGWSQCVLAELGGVSQTAISQFEAGRATPSLEAILSLVRALGRELALDFPLAADKQPADQAQVN